MAEKDYQALLSSDRLEEQLADAKPLYTEPEALVEANRCLFCYDAPCIHACPTAIDIPKFIKQIASGNIRGSSRTILSVNMLGASCARVCPVDVLCAGACVYNELNKQPIAIGRLQRFATTQALVKEKASGRKLFEPAPDTGKKVALIGAGPASLACAAHLALAGVKPVVFEGADLPGGLNTTGVAPYKFHAADALEEVAWLLAHGVDLRCGVTVGKDIAFEQLTKDYDALFVGVGLGRDRMLGYKGEGVWGATQIIRAIKNNAHFKLPQPCETVVVVGGGNTAIDIARELAMLGIEDVRMVYRRSQSEMSGYPHEMAGARKYNVRLSTGYNPDGIRLEKGRVVAAKFTQRDCGVQLVIPCDLVVMAVGQEKCLEILGANMEYNENGTIKVDAITRETTQKNIFAGGDCINGGKEVVNAAADGRDAAAAIVATLCK